MKRTLKIICIALLWSISLPALADIKYYSDPVHKSYSKDDPPAMSDMIDLANQGDVRAMFILGDMYEKGKGGLPKDQKQARQWFEDSAMHGYNQAFIRLAAMAKRANNPIEAWQWYSLAIKNFDSGNTQQYVIRARKALTESANLSSADTDQGRKAMSDWETARDKYLRDEKDAARKASVDAADKDKAAREQAEKDTKAAQDAKDKAAMDAAEKTSVEKDSTEEDSKGQSAKDKNAKNKAAVAATAQQDKKQEQQEKEDDEQN